MRLAALLGALALLATACGGGKPAASAADVAPRSTLAFLTVTRVPAARALSLSAAGRHLQALVGATRWARFAPRAQIAFGPTGTVAYVLPGNRKQFERELDARGLTHARVHGWEAFAPLPAAVAAARHAKRPLSSAPWFARAERGAGRGDAVLVEHGWRATWVDGDALDVARAGRGASASHPLAAAIPSDSVFAYASHTAATDAASLPLARQLRAGVGLTLADLGATAGSDTVLYARAGAPLPRLTLLSLGGSPAAARRLVHGLDADAPPGLPATVDGHTLEDVAFSALDIYYGRVGRTLAVTIDPDASLVHARSVLRPPGLPAATVAWVWADLPRALPQLGELASLAGTRVSPGFAARFAGLRTILQYETAGHGVRTVTLVAR